MRWMKVTEVAIGQSTGDTAAVLVTNGIYVLMNGILSSKSLPFRWTRRVLRGTLIES